MEQCGTKSARFELHTGSLAERIIHFVKSDEISNGHSFSQHDTCNSTVFIQSERLSNPLNAN